MNNFSRVLIGNIGTLSGKGGERVFSASEIW